MLRKLESPARFLAELPVFIVEACFVYYIRTLPSASLLTGPFPLSGKWISPTLGQCWLAGALIALFCYLILALRADPEKAPQGRRTSPRTWHGFLALASAQGCALYVGRLALVQR
jgi:hypothetical protein